MWFLVGLECDRKLQIRAVGYAHCSRVVARANFAGYLESFKRMLCCFAGNRSPVGFFSLYFAGSPGACAALQRTGLTKLRDVFPRKELLHGTALVVEGSVSGGG